MQLCGKISCFGRWAPSFCCTMTASAFNQHTRPAAAVQKSVFFTSSCQDWLPCCLNRSPASASPALVIMLPCISLEGDFKFCVRAEWGSVGSQVVHPSNFRVLTCSLSSLLAVLSFCSCLPICGSTWTSYSSLELTDGPRTVLKP